MSLSRLPAHGAVRPGQHKPEHQYGPRFGAALMPWRRPGPKPAAKSCGKARGGERLQKVTVKSFPNQRADLHYAVQPFLVSGALQNSRARPQVNESGPCPLAAASFGRSVWRWWCWPALLSGAVVAQQDGSTQVKLLIAGQGDIVAVTWGYLTRLIVLVEHGAALQGYRTLWGVDHQA